MIISRIVLKNWRNFRHVDVELGNRAFLVGPNASGKSNFLDAMKFLRDIAKPGGGLQKAVGERGGLSKIRCLAARQYPNVELEVHLSEYGERQTLWSYAIGIGQQVRGYRLPLLKYETVCCGDTVILRRPNDQDMMDSDRLTQTHLEQINSNQEFREVARFLESVTYLHMIPQLLKRIERALQIAVPQLKELTDTRDEGGMPHLEAVYEHWRAQGAKQREDQFSDGTLRLLGLLWALLDGDSLLLLEEPELSLNTGIIMKLPALMYRLQQQKRRQIILSTHSADMLFDKGIGGEEVLLLSPSREGTEVVAASSMREIRDLLDSGLSAGEAIIPHTRPERAQQLPLELFR